MSPDTPLQLLLDDGRSVPYRIRVSRRSKRVRLTLTPREGLVMVTPPGVSRDWLINLANEWRGWVVKQMDQMGIAEPTELHSPEPVLPDRIDLPAIGETWHLLQRYSPGAAPRTRESAAGSLLLSGDVRDADACRKALMRWLIRRAREALPPMLAKISAETGLHYREVSIRAQRTRWGSCSSHGDICLNYQILFLTPELARHVLLHELCHTVRLDHSPRFWRTVARFEPDLTVRRAEMRRSWSLVPAWLHAVR
jgi:predicted metal-dependent hydrolase